jgi:hypothetical protein
MESPPPTARTPVPAIPTRRIRRSPAVKGREDYRPCPPSLYGRMLTRPALAKAGDRDARTNSCTADAGARPTDSPKPVWGPEDLGRRRGGLVDRASLLIDRPAALASCHVLYHAECGPCDLAGPWVSELTHPAVRLEHSLHSTRALAQEGYPNVPLHPGRAITIAPNDCRPRTSTDTERHLGVVLWSHGAAGSRGHRAVLVFPAGDP